MPPDREDSSGAYVTRGVGRTRPASEPGVLELAAGLVGIALGALGTLVGAGGGFLLVPLLALVEPAWSSEQITAFSLAVVTANAATGAVSYWRARRVDVRSFPYYAAAQVPGAAIGAYVTAFLPRRIFDPLFGATLIAIAAWLVFRPAKASVQRAGRAHRVIVDAAGQRYEWSFDPRIGVAGSGVIGFFSSLLGIGGGIIHVPLLATVLGYPAHVATATSHAVLAVTAAVGTSIHVAHGDYRADAPLVACTCLGAVIGAPFGARLSAHVPGPAILRVLAVALAFVGVRLLLNR